MTKGEQINSTVRKSLYDLREAGKKHLSEEQMKTLNESIERTLSGNLEGVLSGMEKAVKLVKDAGK